MRAITLGVLLAACATVPEPVPEPASGSASEPAPESATESAPEPASAPEPTAEPRPHPIDPRIAHLRSITGALRACRGDALPTPQHARCLCEAICRQRFPADEATTTFRFPFIDVDGFEFTVEPDGAVSRCRYAYGAQVLAEQRCGGDDSLAAEPDP